MSKMWSAGKKEAIRVEWPKFISIFGRGPFSRQFSISPLTFYSAKSKNHLCLCITVKRNNSIAHTDTFLLQENAFVNIFITTITITGLMVLAMVILNELQDFKQTLSRSVNFSLKFVKSRNHSSIKRNNSLARYTDTFLLQENAFFNNASKKLDGILKFRCKTETFAFLLSVRVSVGKMLP